VHVDAAGKVVVVANYGGGSVASYSIGTDGTLSKPGSVIQHEGSSVHPKRQARPHAHSINVHPGGRFAAAADLGTDEVLVYKLDASAGKLTPHGAAKVAPGAGPRHLAFHPEGTTAYVLNELNRTVTAFTFDAESGALTKLQTISSVPDGVTEGNSAEVRCSADGRFLYTSNRGHDSIASFAIDPTTGKLTPTGHVSTGGNWPRNFTLSPSGRWLLVANEHSSTIVVFRLDPKTGVPAPTGQVVTVPVPVCLRFWQG
jgi:6-phosphogluconolactonase